MTKHKTLFLTQRGLQHQRWALEGAPPELALVMRRGATREELLALLADAEFLITERTGVIDAGMIAAAPKLRLIQRLGRQTWDLDLDAARQAGVPVCTWPINGCVLVAEQMMLQMLGLLKRLREGMAVTAVAADYGIETHRGDEDHFAYNWSQRGGIGRLTGSTVGILGFGEIGLELVEQLRGFHCTVLYHKRTRLPAAVEAQLGIEYAAPGRSAGGRSAGPCTQPDPHAAHGGGWRHRRWERAHAGLRQYPGATGRAGVTISDCVTRI